VKLKYDGFRFKGKQVFPNGGEIYVQKGNIYDIPDEFADMLLSTGCWKKDLNIKKAQKVPKKEIKEESKERKVVIDKITSEDDEINKHEQRL